MLTENEGSSKPHQKSSETMYVLSSKERVERERGRERKRGDFHSYPKIIKTLRLNSFLTLRSDTAYQTSVYNEGLI